ncbi:MAG: hypothetical protein NWF00_11090 [Candidatus Bathyarchaeota archaeon]|nr:hypothetical protein [Candidatus Bathyarchaeota archaeon]
MILTFLQSILGSLGADLAFALVLILIGVVIIVLIRFFIVLLPAVIIAVIVWLFTGSIFWAGIVFLIIAAFSLLKRL